MKQALFLLAIFATIITACTSQPPRTTLVFQVRTTQPTDTQLSHMADVVRKRLAILGVNARQIAAVDGDALHVELVASKAELELVERAVSRQGYVEYFERKCFTPRCENPGEYEDLSAGIDSHDITSAVASKDPVTGSPVILVSLYADSAHRLAELTSRLARTRVSANPDRLVVRSDDEVLMAPVVIAPILSGEMQIVGPFNESDARVIAAQLASGPLPFPLTLTETR